MRRVTERERERDTHVLCEGERERVRECEERGFPVSNYDLIYQINSSRGLA